MHHTGLDLSPGSAAWNCVFLNRLLHLSEVLMLIKGEQDTYLLGLRKGLSGKIYLEVHSSYSISVVAPSVRYNISIRLYFTLIGTTLLLFR